MHIAMACAAHSDAITNLVVTVASSLPVVQILAWAAAADACTHVAFPHGHSHSSGHVFTHR